MESHDVEDTDAGRFACTVGCESPWFRGHFPGNPVFPGVAILAHVARAVRLYAEAGAGAPMELVSVKRIKFRRVVRPGDPVRIVVAPVDGEAGTYTFDATACGEPACTGYMTVAAPEAGR